MNCHGHVYVHVRGINFVSLSTIFFLLNFRTVPTM